MDSHIQTALAALTFLGVIVAWAFRLEHKASTALRSIQTLETATAKMTLEIAQHQLTTIQLARMEERVENLADRVAEQNETIRELFNLHRQVSTSVKG